MSYFAEVFPGKYACTAVSLLREGFGLLFDGTGSGLKCYTDNGFNLKKYYLVRPGHPGGRTINPLYALLESRYASGDIGSDLARMFQTKRDVISLFVSAMRNEWGIPINSSTGDAKFAIQLGYYFGHRIFGLGYAVSLPILKEQNNTFAWDSFRIAGMPLENIRIRA